MKVKKIITLFTVLAMTQISFGQKVKIKKNVVSINKEAICKVEKDDVVRGSFYINDLQDNQKLYLKWIEWGEESYYEIYNADDLETILFESEDGIGFKKWIIKKLYNSKVLSSSGINEKKLNEFAKKMGREYTRKRNRY